MAFQVTTASGSRIQRPRSQTAIEMYLALQKTDFMTNLPVPQVIIMQKGIQLRGPLASGSFPGPHWGSAPRSLSLQVRAPRLPCAPTPHRIKLWPWICQSTISRNKCSLSLYTVSQKLCKIVFCHNLVKLPPILIIFGREMAKRIKLCEVHSLSTSPISHHHTTVLNADVPYCQATQRCKCCYLQ